MKMCVSTKSSWLTQYGYTPLYMACTRCHDKDVAERLVAAGATIDLLCAAAIGNISWVEDCLRRPDIDINKARYVCAVCPKYLGHLLFPRL